MNNKVELTEQEGCRRQLRIEVDPALVGRTREQVVSKLKTSAKVPGFREGHIPDDVVRKRFSKEIEQGVLEELIPRTYLAAIRDESLEPVSDPEISAVEHDGDRLAYTAGFDAAPVVDLSDFDGLSLERQKVEISDEQVNQVLEQVIARDPGLRTRAADISARQQLRAEVRRRMENETAAHNSLREDEAIIDQLLARARLEAPQTLVTRQAVRFAREEISRTVPDFSRRPKEEREKIAGEMVTKMRPRAEREVKASFVLREVARRENVTVSDDDLNARIGLMARMSECSREELEARLDEEAREDLRARIRIGKTLDVLKRRALLLEKPRIVRA